MNYRNVRQSLRGSKMAVLVMTLVATKIYAVTLAPEPSSVQLIETQEVEGNYYVNVGVCVFCTLFAGMMSGLTIGLSSIDRLSLEVDSIGNPKVQVLCDRVFPVIDKHHWMLVTLLLCNAGAMETLPIFLDKLVTPTEAIVLSVTLILIFGEVIPQAVCTGPNQLQIAFYMCPIVLFLMVATSPISWPIARILDWLLGEHMLQRYDNNQLKKLVMLHSMEALKKVESHLPEGIQGLTHEQAKIVEGAITFQEVACHEVMTKIDRVKYTLTMDRVMDTKTLKEIKINGFSRVPIIHDDVIIGILLTKSLIGIDPSQGKTLQELYIEKQITVRVPVFIN